MAETTARPRRSRMALGLRGLMLLVLASGGGLGYLAHRAQLQRRAVAAIRAAGGMVWYDFQVEESVSRRPPGAPPPPPPGPAWLRRLVGDEYFQEVVGVRFSNSGSVKAGKGVASLSDLPYLRQAIFNAPGVDDATLDRLSHCPRLEDLWLYGARVTDIGVAKLAVLTRLSSVDLIDSPGVTDAGVELLARTHPGLESLHLDGTGLTDASAVALGKLAGLKVLGLDRTRITDAGLAHLGPLSGLEFLTLRDTAVSDDGLRALRGASKLLTLHLDRTAISDGGLAHLSGMTELRFLELGSTRITDAGLARLEGLKSLTGLSVADTAIGDAGLARLSNLTSLIRLDLGRTRVSDAGLAHLRGLARLQILMTESSNVTDVGYTSFRRAMPGVSFGSNRASPRPTPPQQE